MKKMSRPVVTASAPKAWHPKTSTKTVFWGENWGGTIKGTGSRAPRFKAMPRMPGPGSVPNSVEGPGGSRPDCRQSVMQNGDLLRCCDSWDFLGKKTKTQCEVFSPGQVNPNVYGTAQG